MHLDDSSKTLLLLSLEFLPPNCKYVSISQFPNSGTVGQSESVQMLAAAKMMKKTH